MQSSDPAALPGLNFGPGRAFCGALTEGAHARGKRSQCIMYWMPGFVRCLQDTGGARGWAHQISCGAGLGSGLAFGDIVASLVGLHILGAIA